MFNTEVIQIPIHFMSSVRSKSSALMIQRVFRGFTVRKSVRKLLAIRNQVREVETSINDTETVELIRLDNKEWLRVNERIMLLLLKLDLVLGVGYGVRELQKAVIRQAIAIESEYKSEEVMETVSFRDKSVDDSSRFVDEVEVEIEGEVKSEQVMDLLLVVADMDTSRCDETGSEVARGNNSEQMIQIVDDSTNLSVSVESVMNATMEVVKEISVYCDPVEGAGMESVTNATAEVVKEIGVNCDSVEDEGMDDNNNNNSNNNKKRSVELLEKLMEDNEKMVTLMTQMFERNEMQTRMINSLSRRVEQLEKTFGCDKPRKKKNIMHSV
ncbi:uncharacterized protein LOC143535214 [Bidens hawaiensis]|uniref:uncharacterized protein LOC143535214 n=1 Tax=Bidens hawaiensis TaxID=980011 RepID=UPI004049FD1D